MHTRTWHVQLNVFEEDRHTRAEAVLTTDAGTELRHAGAAFLHPDDRAVAEIGDELAVSRALSGLAQELLEAAVVDARTNGDSAAPPHMLAD